MSTMELRSASITLSRTDHVVICLVRDRHAHQDLSEFLPDKRADISKFGRTYWACSSGGIELDHIVVPEPIEVLFVSPASRYGPTEAMQDRQTPVRRFWEFSPDRLTWERFPEKLSRVTKPENRRVNHWALVLEQLDTAPPAARVDLRVYSQLDGVTPLRFNQTVHAACALKRPSRGGMASYDRRLLARGLLQPPGFVHIRRSASEG
jgi:hypothetical protein